MPGDQLIDSAAVFAPLAGFRRLGLAVSGGPDSLALLLLAHHYAEPRSELDRFVVYTVDHGLRPEAAAEAAFVVSAAERLGLAARALRWDGPKPAAGLQQAAREARYRLIGEAMRADGADVLLTAHHLRDQAETVLMRLAHGSGIEGLRGMDYFAEIGGVAIVRPLLGIDPEALRRVVEAAGLVPVEDPSNADADYERVRWRQALPQLTTLGLTPERLARFAGRMRDAEQALAAMADQVVVQVDPGQGSQSVLLETFRRLPRAVAVRVLGRMLREVGGGQKPHDLGPIEMLNEKLTTLPALKRTTLHGCFVMSDGSTVAVAPEPGRRATRSKVATSETRN